MHTQKTPHRQLAHGRYLMQRTRFLAMTLGVVLATVSTGRAQIEPIGPLVLVPGQPISQVFTNLLPPNPDYKELQFTGIANAPPGAFSDLQIDFDYVDSTGNTVVVGAPNSPINVIGGMPTMFDSGILRLPFCPSVVSLHLTNLDPTGVPIDLVGDFRHECFPVPEPGSLGMMAGAIAALCGLGRRIVRG